METKIKELKNQVIELIKEKVNGEETSFFLHGSDCFDSIPMWVPHGSEMSDVYIDGTIIGDCVEFKVDGEGGGFTSDDDDNEPETFELSELTLHQLTLILSLI
jgi:hypothetical protein